MDGGDCHAAAALGICAAADLHAAQQEQQQPMLAGLGQCGAGQCVIECVRVRVCVRARVCAFVYAQLCMWSQPLEQDRARNSPSKQECPLCGKTRQACGWRGRGTGVLSRLPWAHERACDTWWSCPHHARSILCMSTGCLPGCRCVWAQGTHYEHRRHTTWVQHVARPPGLLTLEPAMNGGGPSSEPTETPYSCPQAFATFGPPWAQVCPRAFHETPPWCPQAFPPFGPTMRPHSMQARAPFGPTKRAQCAHKHPLCSSQHAWPGAAVPALRRQHKLAPFVRGSAHEQVMPVLIPMLAHNVGANLCPALLCEHAMVLPPSARICMCVCVYVCVQVRVCVHACVEPVLLLHEMACGTVASHALPHAAPQTPQQGAR